MIRDSVRRRASNNIIHAFEMYVQNNFLLLFSVQHGQDWQRQLNGLQLIEQKQENVTRDSRHYGKKTQKRDWK